MTGTQSITHISTPDSSAARHTPGPWTIEGNGYGALTIHAEYVPHGAIATVAVQDPQCDGSRDGAIEMANARLIAGAPELLEALKSIEAWCSRDGAKIIPSVGARMSRCRDLARAAIAKAEGRSQ